MVYIVGLDRNQINIITTSLDDLIAKDNAVRVIDSYVESFDLKELGFTEHSGTSTSSISALRFTKTAYLWVS